MMSEDLGKYYISLSRVFPQLTFGRLRVIIRYASGEYVVQGAIIRYASGEYVVQGAIIRSSGCNVLGSSMYAFPRLLQPRYVRTITNKRPYCIHVFYMSLGEIPAQYSCHKDNVSLTVVFPSNTVTFFLELLSEQKQHRTADATNNHIYYNHIYYGQYVGNVTIVVKLNTATKLMEGSVVCPKGYVFLLIPRTLCADNM